MTTAVEPSDLASEAWEHAAEAWDHDGQLCREVGQRFSDQFAEELLGEDTMPLLCSLYRTLAEHEPLTLLVEHLSDLPVPPFTLSDPGVRARKFPAVLRATAADFFRTVIELVTRYANEFITRNTDLASSAPEHNREHYFLNRTMDRILGRLKQHFDGPPDDAAVELGVA